MAIITSGTKTAKNDLKKKNRINAVIERDNAKNNFNLFPKEYDPKNKSTFAYHAT